ncbi:hypothetical protein PUNSTDRAFT_105508 [Punctularia strigosozonata HHB-11173 SS5]|uniref:uncharacterized protein n=1 Tax=Punctularia strigosozonata (strain HHB-11173) TaxID=741275 RepID=UPI0004417040|nr:uncharacterized protein PUNSTDRAFT_105508 [Punctularia strigosozonata HHB-11173 SS5]EIN06489.1 hypothetical protein PUNSTDRAFT_105508 [Punctularia strigosozonata HHB-11173 SS5]
MSSPAPSRHGHSGDSDPRKPGQSSRVPQQSYIPSIYILKPPKPQYSPHADERCITYCSQSIRGRTEQKEPWCRSICIRRVFEHEVRRVLTTYTFPMGKAMPNNAATEELKIPLPPEGQDPSAVLEGTVIGRLAHGLDDGDFGDDEHAHIPARLASSTGDKPPETKYWKAGWYIWASKSKWAALERMDKMSMPLQSEHDWECYKLRRNEEWARHNGVPLPRDPTTAPFSVNSNPEEQRLQDEMWTAHQNGIPYPISVGQSILVALPPPSPFPAIHAQLGNVLKPTGKVLELFQKSLSDGSQKEFASKLLEKAGSSDPWVFARNAMGRAWEHMWKKGGDGESPSEV